MFSTEIRITIIPTVFNNVNLYELLWTDKVGVYEVKGENA